MSLRKRCEEAAARLMVEDNMDPKRLVNGPDWWWEDHAKTTIADIIEAEAMRFAAEAQTDRVMRKFWHEQFAWFWRFFRLDESKGEPWLCNETRTQLLNMQDRAALADRYREALDRLVTAIEWCRDEAISEIPDNAAKDAYAAAMRNAVRALAADTKETPK